MTDADNTIYHIFDKAIYILETKRDPLWNMTHVVPVKLIIKRLTMDMTFIYIYIWVHYCREKYQSPQICRWHHPYGRKWRRTKEPLDESERGEWKSWLKTQHSRNKDHGSQSHHFMANRWGNNANSNTLYFFQLQNHCRWWLQPWN